MLKRTVCFLVCAIATCAESQEAETLPIREITAFKDGHALVLRAGYADVTASGDITLADLPRPIMGTFWAEENEESARLASVTVASISEPTKLVAATIEDLLRANIGRSIVFRSPDQDQRTGLLLDIIEEQPTGTQVPEPYWNGYSWVSPPAPPQARPQRLALLKIGDEVAALPIGHIQDVRFIGDSPSLEIIEDQAHERMTLDLDWEGEPAETADVSLMYIERGLRWIPSYRITMLDGDRVNIELQATLINELADLNSVKLHLAIGVPKFAFEHTPDPVALREQLDSLGMFFQRTADGQTGAMLSNAIMAQTARMSEYRLNSGNRGRDSEGSQPASPALTGSERAEDLYVFSIENISLSKGARMVVPLVSYEVSSSSVYRLDLPASPPVQALQHFNNDQHRQLAQLLNRPTAMHLLRIKNDNPEGYPITTAPAMIVKDGRTLAQGLLTYAAPGAIVDLEVGAAVDIAVDTHEQESGRQPDAQLWNGYQHSRIDIASQIQLTNRKPHKVTVEVRKLAFGLPGVAGQNGKAVALSVFGDELFVEAEGVAWWRWYSWPYYWHRLNGASRFTWTVELESGADTCLDASWHYFWR